MHIWATLDSRTNTYITKDIDGVHLLHIKTGDGKVILEGSFDNFRTLAKGILTGVEFHETRERDQCNKS